MDKILKWATGEDGKRYNVDNFKSKAEAQKQKYHDNYGNIVAPVLCVKKERHFRKIEGSHGGNGGSMTDVHKFAQERFIAFFKSPFPLKVSYYDSKFKKISFDLNDYYDCCEMEGNIDGLRADILLTSQSHPDYPPILIEVLHSHACEFEKIQKKHLIIEFKVEKIEDVIHRLRNLNENDTRDIDPDVRFHNFRERESELPWQKSL